MYSVVNCCLVLLQCWVLWTNTLFPAARLANHSSGRLAGVLNTQQTWSMEICNYTFCRKCASWFMLWRRPRVRTAWLHQGHIQQVTSYTKTVATKKSSIRNEKCCPAAAAPVSDSGYPPGFWNRWTWDFWSKANILKQQKKGMTSLYFF